MTKVAGNCPMGCGSTLFVGEGGHITCSYIECPDPCAVDAILADREIDHIAILGEETFSLKHPLRERVSDELLDCALHQHIKALSGPPRVPGRYRVWQDVGGEWIWEPLS